jgi:hypothetical protein
MYTAAKAVNVASIQFPLKPRPMLTGTGDVVLGSVFHILFAIVLFW